jgi:hypothetical protein
MVSKHIEGQTEQERHVHALRTTILGVATDIGTQMQLRQYRVLRDRIRHQTRSRSRRKLSPGQANATVLLQDDDQRRLAGFAHRAARGKKNADWESALFADHNAVISKYEMNAQ